MPWTNSMFNCPSYTVTGTALIRALFAPASLKVSRSFATSAPSMRTSSTRWPGAEILEEISAKCSLTSYSPFTTLKL